MQKPWTKLDLVVSGRKAIDRPGAWELQPSFFDEEYFQRRYCQKTRLNCDFR